MNNEDGLITPPHSEESAHETPAPDEPIKWEPIKEAFIQGELLHDRREFPTLHQLAQRFGVSWSAITKRSAREKWILQRETFLNDLEKKGRELVVQRIAEQGETVDIFGERSYKRFKFIESLAFEKKKKKGKDGKLSDEANIDIDPYRLRAIVETIIMANEQQRMYHNLLAKHQPEEAELAGVTYEQRVTLLWSEIQKKIKQAQDKKEDIKEIEVVAETIQEEIK